MFLVDLEKHVHVLCIFSLPHEFRRSYCIGVPIKFHMKIRKKPLVGIIDVLLSVGFYSFKRKIWEKIIQLCFYVFCFDRLEKVDDFRSYSQLHHQSRPEINKRILVKTLVIINNLCW